MFVRSKKVKQFNYAYLVSSKWTKNGARQKVSRYLGRIQELKQESEAAFTFDYENSDASETIRQLVSWVLKNYGFSAKGKYMIFDSIKVNLLSGHVRRCKKPVVLKLNGDYMCTQTLRKLISWTSDKDRGVAATELAKAFISAGIPVPQEVFIDVFMKSYKQGQSFID